MKDPVKEYYKPVPVKWRKLGDALLATSSTISGYAIVADMKWLALTSLVFGAVGKFLTNFFSE